MKTRSIEGGLQLILWGLLVVATVYACKPAVLTVDAGGHDPATCRVCLHPNSQVGGGDAAHGLIVGTERHLASCRACRESGRTVDDLLAADTPTPCMSTEGDSRP